MFYSRLFWERERKRRTFPNFAFDPDPAGEHLYEIAERLRGVEVDCDGALNVLERYDSPKTLFYLDPPYVSSTRNRWKKHAYAHEMTNKQHRELARAVHELQGMVLISGYQCELYDTLYGDWTRVEKEARTNSQYATATESLWISPAAMAAKLPLFSLEEGR